MQIVRNLISGALAIPFSLMAFVCLFGGLIAFLVQIYLWNKHGIWYNSHQALSDFQFLMSAPLQQKSSEYIVQMFLNTHPATLEFVAYNAGIGKILVWFLSFNLVIVGLGFGLIILCIEKLLGATNFENFYLGLEGDKPTPRKAKSRSKKKSTS